MTPKQQIMNLIEANSGKLHETGIAELAGMMEQPRRAEAKSIIQVLVNSGRVVRGERKLIGDKFLKPLIWTGKAVKRKVTTSEKEARKVRNSVKFYDSLTPLYPDVFSYGSCKPLKRRT